MPVGKKTKKKIQQNKSSTTAVATQSVHDVTVRDCLLWPDDHKKRSTSTGHDDVVYVSMRQQQQQQQCQSSTQVRQMHPPAQPEDDGTVSDALRGWPRYIKQCEQMQQKRDNDSDSNVQVLTKTKTKTGQTTKAAKSKSKSTVAKEKDEDIHVADLISQRFLHEYTEQRQAEMECDRKKKEARERAAREGRRAAKDRTDIKANKAAQLRAIALADRVEASPFDLWKMEKFTRSARPHVSTFRNGQRPSGASASGSGGDGDRTGRGGASRGGYGGFSGRSSGTYEDEELNELVSGACTCPDKPPYYYGRDVPYYYGRDVSYYYGRDVYGTVDECDDERLTTDVDNFDDGTAYVYSYINTSHQSPSPISAL